MKISCFHNNIGKSFVTTYYFLLLFANTVKKSTSLGSKKLWSTPSSAIDVALNLAQPLDEHDVGKNENGLLIASL